ncbi:hypothetical protein B0I31_106208 [Saccharothrix carnea]|uniref:Uncharacterized protein n=1 Tax=Saccharothrix carnea TaxID=1280637 RepID=A0A2P8I891_SACCR|nr:hypothetical protein [Saccharothrix carnea]PSL54692.1 hypothetical protein B0I31_106208 [Saccharothrix carnea]
MSNDDKRRRQDGSTAKLSVADLLARREAETQPIPRITAGGTGNQTAVGGTGLQTAVGGTGTRITERPAVERPDDDEETVRFSAAALAGATNLSGRELHVTELLRREGRAGEEERGGGFSVPKLVAMASGGVVLAGTVAFTASNLMSSPDERPLAEVRFDARPAARATNTLTKDLAAAAAQQQAQQPQAETTTTTPEQAPEPTTQRAPRPNTQQQQQTTTTTTQQQTQQQAPTSTTTQPPSSSSQQTTTPAPSTSTTTPPPPSSNSTQPPSSSTPPSSSNPSTPPSEDNGSGLGLDLDLDLGGILNPIGGFDFFAPAS